MGSTSPQPNEPVKQQSSVPVGVGEAPGRSAAARSKSRMRLYVALGVVAIIVIGFVIYRYLAAWESTDDAQIDGYIYPVSARVSGYVVHVLVDNNQVVQAGTVLVQLDPKDYQVAV